MNPMTTIDDYHQRTKHALPSRWAAGPETLDWDAQPDPFRRWDGAPVHGLPLGGADPAGDWPQVLRPGAVAAQPLSRAALGRLLELSLGLSAWKQAGADRWAVRMNPSSGNLHPTEGWILCRGLPDLPDGLHHYAPREHRLERRASIAPAAGAAPRAFVALSSVAWREAWKYGERAWRYVQLDTGHAIGALRFAAALLGWRLQRLDEGSARLAALLGLDRDEDFGRAEREEAEALFELLPAAADAPAGPAGDDAFWHWTAPGACAWHGTASRLDRHPMYRWPVIDAAAVASRPPAAVPPGPQTAPALDPALPRPAAEPQPAARLIRQRRSAQRFDARSRIEAAALWSMLQALDPADPGFDLHPGPARVHLLVFAHRVEGVAPGAYLLGRGDGALERLRDRLGHGLGAPLDWAEVDGAPAGLALRRLATNPALAGTLRTIDCHQALGSDAAVAFALLAEFQPLPGPWAYRTRLQEAGLIGQRLYLEAEAAGLRGTGIGCFFDDTLHALVGIAPPEAAQAPLQSVYHFTVGVPLHDPRIVDTPPHDPGLPRPNGDLDD